MKICYIWIERFRNFENFGFNLSSSQKFKYDSKINILSRVKIDPLPVNFFGDRIEDVVGIIGKNGAGKSNAIELICKILKGAKTSLQTDFFVLVEIDGNITCHYSFGNKAHPNADFRINFEEYSGNINPLKLVFFSNVFDERNNDFDREVSDISVNKNFSRKSFFRKAEITDFEKQISLIKSKIFPYLNIELPTKVQLTSRVWTDRFSMTMNLNAPLRNNDVIRNLKKTFRDRIRDIRPENKLIHLLRFGYFFDFLNEISKRGRNTIYEYDIVLQDIENFIPQILNLRTEEISERLIDFIENLLDLSLQQINLLPEKEKAKQIIANLEKFKKQTKFLKDLKYSKIDLEIKYNSEGSRNRNLEYFTFDYTSNSVKAFIIEFVSLFEQSNFFNINWLGISSGHKAYLNLFASIFQELKYTRQLNLLLCIDEGDLYLHPKWQIEFFDKLITVLPIFFSGRIQLILTSHSPFLLSDLPNQNITILGQSIDNSSLDGIDLSINTFGGNLYDLYSEPLFLGNKRMSDFSYKKIRDLIDSVENKKLSIQDKETFLRMANLVGDEIIQYQIKKTLE